MSRQGVQLFGGRPFPPEPVLGQTGGALESGESARILRHEQTHFDLTEVYARRMRRFFEELYNPCGRPEEELPDVGERFVREEADAQRRYDNETGMALP